MAANGNPLLSTMATSELDLPVVEVFKRDGDVVVKLGESGAMQTTGQYNTIYSDAPYSFSALDSTGCEPFIKSFGSLLTCDGGTLTFEQKNYRIVRVWRADENGSSKKRVIHFEESFNNKRLQFYKCISAGIKSPCKMTTNNDKADCKATTNNDKADNDKAAADDNAATDNDEADNDKAADDDNAAIKVTTDNDEAAADDDKAPQMITFACELFGENGAGTVLYIRDCYKELFTEIEKKRSERTVGGAVITGTPGIGKTMCAAYFIHRYMHLSVTVLLKFRNEGYFLFSATKDWAHEGTSFHLSAELAEGQKYYIGNLGVGKNNVFTEYLKTLTEVVYIVDLNRENFEESLPSAFTVILTSSNKEKYASAVTSAHKTVSVFWMPIWSLVEVRQHYLNTGLKTERLSERYDVHGGVLRYLLWKEEDAKLDLKRVLDSSTKTDFESALDKDCKNANISGRLVHYKLSADNSYHTSRAVFASNHIKHRVATRFYLRERLKFAATVDKMKFDSSFGSARGFLSELVWHHQLREGGNFKMKAMEIGNSGSRQGVTNVAVAQFSGEVVTCEEDMRDLLTLKEGDYVSPFGKLPAVDAFMVTKKPFFEVGNTTDDLFLVGFQMAGSKKRDHWLKGPQVVNWIACAKKLHPTISKIAIVFVVNTEDLGGWNKQAFKTKDKAGLWKNYTLCPGDLKDVRQIGLGMPPGERDGP